MLLIYYLAKHNMWQINKKYMISKHLLKTQIVEMTNHKLARKKCLIRPKILNNFEYLQHRFKAIIIDIFKIK